MAGEHPDRRAYILNPPRPVHVTVNLAELGILDGWLADFDAKLATLNERQDAFFEKMGIHVINRHAVEPEAVVDAEFEER